MFYGPAMTVGGMAIAEGLGRAIGTHYAYSTAFLYAVVSVTLLIVAAVRGELSR